MEAKDSASAITSDFIYLEMRERIVSGQWKPGQRLVQRTLAKEFGSSSIPVLESIRRLESEHLVTSLPNVGAKVRTWTASDIESVYAARAALEGVTCRLFAEQASLAEKDRVATLSRQFDEEFLNERRQESAQTDVNLHLYIMNRSMAAESRDALSALAQKAFLLSITIRSVTINSLEKMGEEVPFGGGPVGAHDALLEAFYASDGVAAERAIHNHVNDAKTLMLEAINMPGFLW